TPVYHWCHDGDDEPQVFYASLLYWFVKLIDEIGVNEDYKKANKKNSDNQKKLLSEDDHELFIKAVENGDVKKVKSFIERGVNLDIRNHFDEFILTLAIDKRHSEIAQMLIENGAKINIVNEKMTALENAIYMGLADIVKILIEKKARFDLKKYILFAADKKSPDVLSLLLDLDIGKKTLNKALLEAAMNGHSESVKLLLKKGADINSQGFNALNYTPLIGAAEKGHMDAAKILLKEGADVNPLDKNRTPKKQGNPAMLKAAYNDHIDMVKLLLKNGVDVDQRGEQFDWTGLIWAAGKGKKEFVKLFLKQGADINAIDNVDYTAINFAASEGYLEIVKILLDKGADLSLLTGDGSNALILAAYSGHTEVVELLMKKGVDINIKDIKGKTALDAAKKQKNTRCINILKGKSESNSIPKELREKLKPFLNKPCIFHSDMTNSSWSSVVFDWGKFSDQERSELLFSVETDIGESIPIGVFSMKDNLKDALKRIDGVVYFSDKGKIYYQKKKDSKEYLFTETIDDLKVNSGVDIVSCFKAISQLGDDLKVNSGVDIASCFKGAEAKRIIKNTDINDKIKKFKEHIDQVDVNTKLNGITMLIEAAESGSFEICKMLISKSAHVNLKGEKRGWRNGMSALTYSLGKPKIVKLLLENGADINARDAHEWTPLMRAYLSIGIVESLLKYGADINAQDIDGESILMKYADDKSLFGLNNARFVLKNSADINLVNNKKESALTIAMNRKNIAMAMLLIENGANVESRKAQNFIKKHHDHEVVFVCDMCKYTYQPSKGNPGKDIEPGTPFEFEECLECGYSSIITK
ncbi:MAG: hypothetical protein GY793_01025, partial [Proteobacteria bacterium]|nr:hypothetical protein [Pseudomonadota bacterium]